MINKEGRMDSARFLREHISGALIEAWTTELTKCVLNNFICGVARVLSETGDGKISHARGWDHLTYFDNTVDEFFTNMTCPNAAQAQTAHNLGLHIVVSDFVLLCAQLQQLARDKNLQASQEILWDRLSLSYADRISDFLVHFQDACSSDQSEKAKTSKFPSLGVERLTSLKDAMVARRYILLHTPYAGRPVLAYSSSMETDLIGASSVANNSGLHVA
ncbi:MAG: hypothetical protein RBR86_06320 [Pseudobdellovibrionaceae bacterium]|jgi:hypothetical protein|nr:hypothetical protein [Pseudobdellovibrionaceae bacterium]